MEDFMDEVLPESIANSPVPQWQVPASSPQGNDAEGIQTCNDDGDIVPLKDVERQMILHALQKTDNNRTHAARMLGISVRTLRNKLHEYRHNGILV